MLALFLCNSRCLHKRGKQFFNCCDRYFGIYWLLLWDIYLSSFIWSTNVREVSVKSAFLFYAEFVHNWTEFINLLLPTSSEKEIQICQCIPSVCVIRSQACLNICRLRFEHKYLIPLLRVSGGHRSCSVGAEGTCTYKSGSVRYISNVLGSVVNPKLLLWTANVSFGSEKFCLFCAIWTRHWKPGNCQP